MTSKGWDLVQGLSMFFVLNASRDVLQRPLQKQNLKTLSKKQWLLIGVSFKRCESSRRMKRLWSCFVKTSKIFKL